MKIKIVETKADPSGNGNVIVSRFRVYRRILGLFWREYRFAVPVPACLKNTQGVFSSESFAKLVYNNGMCRCLVFPSKEEALEAVKHCEGDIIDYKGVDIVPCMRVFNDHCIADTWMCVDEFNRLIVRGEMEYCREKAEDIVARRRRREDLRYYRKEEIVEV